MVLPRASAGCTGTIRMTGPRRGASSAGVDTVAGKTFRVPALSPVNPDGHHPARCHSGSSVGDSAAFNQGIMLVNNNPGEIVNPVSTVGTQAMRPKLTIVIAAASGVQVAITPASVTMQPGATRQFTATVTGASNTAVHGRPRAGPFRRRAFTQPAALRAHSR